MRKLLSVIVPAYNMERYLRKCLGSLCINDHELFNQLDVIVVNDGSKDKTSAIAHEFSENYPDVFRVIDKENGHYGSCVNRALPLATGHFIRMLDADDSFDSNEFERFLSELNHLQALSPSVDLVLSHVRYINMHEETLLLLELPLNGRNDLSIDDLTKLKSGRFNACYTYRRSIFDDLNYHQSEGVAYTDTEWIFLPMTRVQRIAHCPLVVYKYLFDREDQSCNFKMVGKQLSQCRQSFDVRFNQYKQLRHQWSPAAVRYAERELAHMIVILHFTYLQHGYLSTLREQTSLDKFISNDLANFRDILGGVCVFERGKHISIDYGKYCVLHPWVRPFLSLALQFKALIHK